MTKSSQKLHNCQNCIPFLESTYPEMQRNLKCMNISRQPAATQLMINIKHQPDRVLADICYQTSTR